MTRRRWKIIAVALGVTFALAVLIRGVTGADSGVALAEAQEQPFDLTIVETGALQALKSVTYASSIQSNQAKIVALAPEGRVVAKGDLLICEIYTKRVAG